MQLFENIVIYLICYPGVGKYTIAKEIAKQANFVVVDNHLINNPVFSVIGVDGKTPLSEEVWSTIDKIRDIVMDTIENLAPRHLNYVLTNHIIEAAHSLKPLAPEMKKEGMSP